MRVTQPVATLLSKVTPDADFAMGSYKFTGLGAGSASGHSVRYEQVIGVYLPLAGGTMTGDLSLGGNILKATNYWLKTDATYGLRVRDPGDTVNTSVLVTRVYYSGDVQSIASGSSLSAQDVNDAHVTLKARDTGAALVEIARLAGAADPYFQMTLPPVITPTARPGVPVAGQIVNNSTLAVHEVYDGVHYKQHVNSIHRTVNYNDTSPVTIITLPAGAIVLFARVNITTAFTADSGVTGIGIAGTVEAYLSSAIINADTTGWKPINATQLGANLYDATNKWKCECRNAADSVIVTLDSTGITQGVMEVYIVYIVLL